MKRTINNIILAVSVSMMPLIAFAQKNDGVKEKDTSTQKERNYIRSGNKLYKEKRYAEAEVEYKKALQINQASAAANYNLATALIRQSGSSDPNDKNSPLKQATDILTNLTKSTKNSNILSKSYYNLGNLAYNQQQYDQSVEYYKNALRQNPNDDQARDNLRLAQLKMKENQNKDKDKDKDKDKNKDKDKQNQDQNKDKNKDQNKDKQNQNQNQDQQDKQNKQSEPQNGMSQDNVEQILKTMQNQEKATQQKINAERKKQSGKRKTGNQW